jgi:hypothetical protein
LGYGNIRVSQANNSSNRSQKLDEGLIYGGGISYQVNKQVAIRDEIRLLDNDIHGFGVGVSLFL